MKYQYELHTFQTDQQEFMNLLHDIIQLRIIASSNLITKMPIVVQVSNHFNSMEYFLIECVHCYHLPNHYSGSTAINFTQQLSQDCFESNQYLRFLKGSSILNLVPSLDRMDCVKRNYKSLILCSPILKLCRYVIALLDVNSPILLLTFFKLFHINHKLV